MKIKYVQQLISSVFWHTFYIFWINVLKFIYNLVSQRFAKDLKELFLYQSNQVFLSDHCDWLRAMLQPGHFHQTLIWICHTEPTAHTCFGVKIKW